MTLTCALIAATTLTAAGPATATKVKPRAKPRAASVLVNVAPGQHATAARALRSRGIRVNRRIGDRLQVVARTPAMRGVISRMPGVASVAPTVSSYPDAVIGQGVDRTGASALTDVARGGAGLRIAIIDLGFGSEIAPLQAVDELPPASRLQTASFDPAGGLAGTTAYGGPTDHGMLVAQAVYDYAPRASYLFVSYHTPEDFVAAVNWLATQRVDIAVHSNNFLEGPFDGTSGPAQAVDRAAAAGVLWFNSAGNYGQKSWRGPWTDADADDELDWPTAGPWIITRTNGSALTYHLSWRNAPGAEPTDIDLALEKQRDDGGWDVIARSTDRQSAGAAAAERLNGLRGDPGRYRLRAILVSGPPPVDVTLYSREDEIAGAFGLGDASPASIPTPADAAGSISVGALDWRSNSLVRYSSRGPTPDGRLKPDITAPTGTAIAGVMGDSRDVGGTSIAAPNAAGATAVLLSSLRANRLAPTPDQVRAMLDRDALDLGAPGPDTTFGTGRLRVDLEAPNVRARTPRPRTPVRGNVRFQVEGSDPSGIASYGLYVDGALIREGRASREDVTAVVPSRSFPDGRHTVEVELGDPVSNRARVRWPVVFDNTRPDARVRVAPVPVVVQRPEAPEGKRRLRRALVRVTASDNLSRSLRLRVIVLRNGKRVEDIERPMRSGVPIAVLTEPLTRGPHRIIVRVTDEAGNMRAAAEPLMIRV